MNMEERRVEGVTRAARGRGMQARDNGPASGEAKGGENKKKQSGESIQRCDAPLFLLRPSLATRLINAHPNAKADETPRWGISSNNKSAS